MYITLLLDTQFSGIYTSLKVNENLANVSLVMLWSSSGQRTALRPEEDRHITVETLARFSSTFKLVPENCVFYMLH